MFRISKSLHSNHLPYSSSMPTDFQLYFDPVIMLMLTRGFFLNTIEVIVVQPLHLHPLYGGASIFYQRNCFPLLFETSAFHLAPLAFHR